LKTAKERRIYTGYYHRYDNQLFYVIAEAFDAVTGEPTVILQEYHLSGEKPYLTVSKESFFEKVEYKGKKIQRFRRSTGQKAPEWVAEAHDPERLNKHLRLKKYIASAEDEIRYVRNCTTYRAYSKDIIDHYKEDRERIKQTVEYQFLIGLESKKDFESLKEDCRYLDKILDTALTEYKDFFTERFVDGKSIRKYAEEHNLNRGSVDHIQQKFYAAFAKQLELRDIKDGVKRLYSTNK